MTVTGGFALFFGGVRAARRAASPDAILAAAPATLGADDTTLRSAASSVLRVDAAPAPSAPPTALAACASDDGIVFRSRAGAAS